MIKANYDKGKLNEGKCKELHIGFNRNTSQFDPILINNNPIEVVECVKLLGPYVSNNLKWNNHIHEMKNFSKPWITAGIKRSIKEKN
jgi:hypothetical protein